MLALGDKVRCKLVKRAGKLQKKLRSGDRTGCAWYMVSCLPLLALTASLLALLSEATTLGATLLAMATGDGSIFSGDGTPNVGVSGGRAQRLMCLALFVFGQLGSKELNRALKSYFAQLRPATSGKEGSLGMPSYHAQASFFATAFVCGDGFSGAPDWWGSNVWRAAAPHARLAYVLAAGISYSRLALGMHTFPQIAVGAGVGCVLASVLVRAATALLAPLLGSS